MSARSERIGRRASASEPAAMGSGGAALGVMR
jgi:hypothetical protein